MQTRDPLTPNDEEIERAIRDAREITWHDWRDAFEHNGPIRTNPILADVRRFNSFCVKWGVGRTIRKGTRDDFRCFLRDASQFAEAIGDDTGSKLAELEQSLRSRFGTSDGTSGILSALSKAAAFVKPERFVAWDQYARRGLNMVLMRPLNKPFESYVEYLADFDRVWEGSHGERIREMTSQAPKQALETEPRFQRRVLDLFLLTKGRNRKPAKSQAVDNVAAG
jgi:hypothetical protein